MPPHTPSSTGVLPRAAARWALALVLLASVPGCAPKRPVLYPNAHLRQVGSVDAAADINACLAAARGDGFGADRAARAGVRTGESAATGAAVGTAVGAVAGHVGRGAAAGAAGGGAAGLVRGLFRWRDPGQIEARYVDICLRDLGYEPIGWR